jgi:hypothetical protein
VHPLVWWLLAWQRVQNWGGGRGGAKRGLAVFFVSLEEKVHSNPALFEAIALQKGTVLVQKGLRRVRGDGGPRSR